MAELNVVRKKKSPFPWILLALVVLGIIAYLVFRNNDVVPDSMEQAADSTISYERNDTLAP